MESPIVIFDTRMIAFVHLYILWPLINCHSRRFPKNDRENPIRSHFCKLFTEVQIKKESDVVVEYDSAMDLYFMLYIKVNIVYLLSCFDDFS